MRSTDLDADIGRRPRPRWVRTAAVVAASAAMTTVGVLAQAGPGSALAAATPATTTMTVDTALAGSLPVEAAVRAWGKGMPITFVMGACSGARCIHIVNQHAVVGEQYGPGTGGVAQPMPDGSCTAWIEPWIDAYADAELASLEHEMGHCMGLPHNTTDPRSIMTPTITTDTPPKGPDAQDRAALKALLS